MRGLAHLQFTSSPSHNETYDKYSVYSSMKLGSHDTKNLNSLNRKNYGMFALSRISFRLPCIWKCCSLKHTGTLLLAYTYLLQSRTYSNNEWWTKVLITAAKCKLIAKENPYVVSASHETIKNCKDISTKRNRTTRDSIFKIL